MMKATFRTARMNDEQLLAHGFTREQIAAGDHLPTVSGGGNSTTIITDLGTVKTAFDSGANAATYAARALAAAGPIQDVDGMITLAQLKAREILEIINYLYGGIAGVNTTGIFRSGDSDHANAYDLLVNIAADLT